MSIKNVLMAIAMITGLSANAQRAADVKPVETNLHLAGAHLERSGKQRNTALFVGLGLGAVAAMVASVDADNAAPALGLGLCGVGVSIGFNIAANANERKAGRILQGK